jgi:hypothetical protein
MEDGGIRQAVLRRRATGRVRHCPAPLSLYLAVSLWVPLLSAPLAPLLSAPLSSPRPSPLRAPLLSAPLSSPCTDRAHSVSPAAPGHGQAARRRLPGRCTRRCTRLSALVPVRQCASVCVSVRQCASACVSVCQRVPAPLHAAMAAAADRPRTLTGPGPRLPARDAARGPRPSRTTAVTDSAPALRQASGAEPDLMPPLRRARWQDRGAHS